MISLRRRRKKKKRDFFFLSFFHVARWLVTDGDARSAPFWCRRNTDDGDGPSAERESAAAAVPPATAAAAAAGGQRRRQRRAGGRLVGRGRARSPSLVRTEGERNRPSVRPSVPRHFIQFSAAAVDVCLLSVGDRVWSRTLGTRTGWRTYMLCKAKG